MKKNGLIAFSIIVALTCIPLLYSFASSSKCKFMPVSFDQFRIPLIEMKIAGKRYPVIIDLGSSAQMSLDKEVLQEAYKKPYGMAQFRDFKGNCYESQNYLVPNIKIGDAAFFDVIVEEKNEEFNHNGIIRGRDEKVPSPRKGSIGRSLLKRRNLFLDFPRSRIAFIDNVNKQMDYPIEGMLKVPFKMTPLGVTLAIQTDIGEKNFVIDTGATTTWVRSSLYQEKEYQTSSCDLDYFSSSLFVIGGQEFGPIDLYLLDISPEWHEMDGLLGMSFCKHHPMYIDFREKMIYIGRRE